MCDKAILENDEVLEFVPDQFKTQKIFDKAGDN